MRWGIAVLACACACSAHHDDGGGGGASDAGAPDGPPITPPGTTCPAIGVGVMCPPTDQRGSARPSTGCTSGSVEGDQ